MKEMKARDDLQREFKTLRQYRSRKITGKIQVSDGSGGRKVRHTRTCHKIEIMEDGWYLRIKTTQNTTEKNDGCWRNKL